MGIRISNPLPASSAHGPLRRYVKKKKELGKLEKETYECKQSAHGPLRRYVEKTKMGGE
jgi:hypothetical protein